ncbi:MAG: GntR family transcriptional regulator [Verrucomicrobia bacterium]|nr:GntR family transcriptional regulator [Verrucomicrobiota bacterium]
MKTRLIAAPAEASANLSARLFGTIQERIVNGRIPPGARLVERVLCEEFTVSRGIVRETLLRLSSCGLVDIAPDAGARVSALTDARILDAFLFREGVETIAAEQCAVRMNREEADQLQGIASRFAQEYAAFNSHRPNQLQQLDMSFHRAIIEGSRNELIQRAWDTSMLHFFRGVRTPPEEMAKDAQHTIVDDHTAIAAAIVAGSAEEAGLKMKQHLQHGRALFIQYTLRKVPLAGPLRSAPRKSRRAKPSPSSP